MYAIRSYYALPAGSGWGVLSQITQQVQALLTHHRQAARAAEELAMVRSQLALMRESLDQWVETERWGGLQVKPVITSYSIHYTKLYDVVRILGQRGDARPGWQRSSGRDEGEQPHPPAPDDVPAPVPVPSGKMA